MVEYERWRLRELGAEQLASKVDWVATSKGDGLGYDVLSYEMDGTPKHIEVKTTAFGISTPFFLTNIELEFAKRTSEQFHLYRLFEFRREPKLFSLVGNPRTHCLLDPVSYRASFY